MKSFVFGTTAWGLAIPAFSFGSRGAPVLVLGGVHGNEPEGVIAAHALLKIFSESFPFNLQLTLVPAFNMDGVAKNSRLNGHGVDLNRNLPTQDWNPEAFDPKYPPGPFANSETENLALVQFLEDEKPVFVLSLHSWKPLLNVNGDCIAEAGVIHRHTGYEIKEEIGYPTPGCLGTYAGLERGMPTLTYEIERGLDPEKIVKTHVPAIIDALRMTEKTRKFMSANFDIEKAKKMIGDAFEGKIDSGKVDVKRLVKKTISALDVGALRVCDPNNKWETQQWIKQAILLYFKHQKMSVSRAGDFRFFDKIPVKKWTGKEGVRVVPQAIARYGSFLERGAIMMPSYVNIGAWIGEGSMVDSWVTVGSCAQIGRGVHLSGGVGIGGVLEPVQASPVIIEDHVFVGSRCIVVEGVHVEEGAVLGAGVVLTASTKILDVTGAQVKTHVGRVPPHSVVIPGTVSKEFPAGPFGVPCALIIGKRSEKTDRKTSLTSVLRDFSVPV